MAWRWLSIGGSDSKVGICKIKFYICRVIRNPQLGLESIQIAGALQIWRLDSLPKQCRTGELLKLGKRNGMRRNGTWDMNT